MEENYDEDGMRRVQWAQRKERMQREKRKQMMIRRISKIVIPAAAVFVIILTVIGVKSCGGHKGGGGNPAAGRDDAAAALGNAEGSENGTGGEEGTGAGTGGAEAGTDGNGVQAEEDVSAGAEGGVQPGEEQEKGSTGGEGDGFTATKLSGEYKTTGQTAAAGDDIVSSYAIFVDIDEGNILMRKDETSRMNPASMTKVLTLLVAAEHIDDLDDTFTMTSEITDYCFVNDCTVAGFEKGDAVSIIDLMYGTILPSGADAALGLAVYVAGSQEAFVEMMNEKLKELGLADTAHFTNCVGIYDQNHYCTAYDMAVIMENVINNDICRQVMSAHTYTTSPTKRFADGIELSNWFLRRIEDKDTGGEVVCGKTGYVAQSGNCAVSYGVDNQGKRYVCVTAGASSPWRCIEDHAYMYKKYSE